MNYQLLFDKLKCILDEYWKKKELRREQGNDFNIFRTMRMQYDEVHTHSAVISALLNPKELHGCKSAFLDAFVSQINVLKEYKDNIDEASVEVEVERSIGNVSQDRENGGRLDIIIRFKTKDKRSPILLIIENKIYAGDEDKQLVRYYNYAEKEKKKDNNLLFYIFYLTLYGTYPSNISTDKRLESDIDYYPISYHDDIFKWLDICKEVAKDKPLIHGIITQYKDLVSTLTHQNMDKETQLKMAAEIVKNHTYMAVALAINDNYGQILHQMCNEKLRPLYIKVAEDNGMGKPHFYGNLWIKQNSGVDFKKESWKHVAVGFEFMKGTINHFCYGVKYQNTDDPLNQKVYEIIQKEFGEGNNGQWWPWYIYDDKYPNWSSEEAINALYDGTMQKHIDSLFKEIAYKVDRIESLLVIQ